MGLMLAGLLAAGGCQARHGGAGWAGEPGESNNGLAVRLTLDAPDNSPADQRERLLVTVTNVGRKPIDLPLWYGRVPYLEFKVLEAPDVLSPLTWNGAPAEAIHTLAPGESLSYRPAADYAVAFGRFSRDKGEWTAYQPDGQRCTLTATVACDGTAIVDDPANAGQQKAVPAWTGHAVSNPVQIHLPVAGAAPTSEPAAPVGPSVTGATFDRPVDAAIAALLQLDSHLHREDLDLAATEKLLDSKDHKTLVDLNGTGNDEIIWDVGWYVLKDGKIRSDDATHNTAWAIVQKGESGLWRIMACDNGWRPTPLKTRTHGWRDYTSGTSIGGGLGSLVLYRFDVRVYATAGSVIVNPGLMDWKATVEPVPDDLAAGILARKLGAAPAKVDWTAGLAFHGQIEGRQEVLLVVLDSAGADGRTISMDELEQHPANVFLFVREGQKWRPVGEAMRLGTLGKPTYDAASHAFHLTSQIGGTLDRPTMFDWTWTDGRLADPQPLLPGWNAAATRPTTQPIALPASQPAR